MHKIWCNYPHVNRYLPLRRSATQCRGAAGKKTLIYLYHYTYAFSMHVMLRRITVFSLLMAIMLGMVTVCCSHTAVTHDAETSLSVCPAQETEHSAQLHTDEAPCGSPESDSDHDCGHACQGPCHAPLSGSPVVVTRTSSFTCLNPSELTWYLPQVYLSLVVPPDSVTA